MCVFSFWVQAEGMTPTWDGREKRTRGWWKHRGLLEFLLWNHLLSLSLTFHWPGWVYDQVDNGAKPYIPPTRRPRNSLGKSSYRKKRKSLGVIMQPTTVHVVHKYSNHKQTVRTKSLPPSHSFLLHYRAAWHLFSCLKWTTQLILTWFLQTHKEGKRDAVGPGRSENIASCVIHSRLWPGSASFLDLLLWNINSLVHGRLLCTSLFTLF